MLQPTPQVEEEMMRKPKRDVLGYIDATIEYERGNIREGPPGGYRRGLSRAEAELVYQSVRKTLAAIGFTLRPEWSPANEYQAQRLDNAYTSRDLDPTLLELE